MKERNFKFRKSFADLVKDMTDKQAGEFIKSVCGYVFDGKPFESKDEYLKGVYLYAQNVLETDARDKANGRLGGAIIAERFKDMKDNITNEQTVCESNIVSQVIIVAAAEQGDTEHKTTANNAEKFVKKKGNPNKSAVNNNANFDKRKWAE